MPPATDPGDGATVFVCADCPEGAARLAAVRAALTGVDCAIRASGCLGGCRSGASVALRAPGRTAYLFGPVTAEDLPFLPILLAQYRADARGEIRDARPLGSLRLRLLARIPAA